MIETRIETRVQTEPPAIPSVLASLRAATSPTGRVLSAYLDTSPRRQINQAYLLAFRDGCKAVRHRLPSSELRAFEAAVDQAEELLAGTGRGDRAGLALFTSGQPSYGYLTTLPRRPVDDVAWGTEPVVEPLEWLLDECERLAVVLFDKSRARIFSICLDEVEEEIALRDDVPGRQATGGWFALAQSRYARHHEDHVLRHARRVLATLSELQRRRPFDRLLLAGPDEALAVLRHHLPGPLLARLGGTIHLDVLAPRTEVVRAAREIGEAIERRDELAAVAELCEAATTPRVALGERATLDALSDERVYRLFLVEDFSLVAGECPSCRRLVAGHRRCPACDLPTHQIGNVGERLVGRAVEQGARVDYVSGEAARLLDAHGGLGAWLRY